MSILFKIKRRIFQFILFSQPLRYWQKYGINVTRNHYYSNIPDLNKLSPVVFSRKSELIGIDLKPERQLQLLEMFVKKYRTEYDSWPLIPEHYFDFHISQTSFRSVDAQILHCMIRYFKPARVIEVGSGYTTMITAKALLMNQSETNKSFNFTAIEPYPNESLLKGIPGLTIVINKNVQDVEMKEFISLNENDVLFLDSTHTVKINGDVNYEILEVLPRLCKGVLVHIHDIFLPYEYPEKWVESGERMWSEQYLLQAFLCNNEYYEIVWASYFMFREFPEKLKSSMNYFEEGVPYKGSIWLKKIK